MKNKPSNKSTETPIQTNMTEYSNSLDAIASLLFQSMARKSSNNHKNLKEKGVS
ncbi:hypothetical protein [Paenibacillus tianmuensis]|uniref:hypothetical protein n=1 Tax=Paenibacillus tianmuensis TaxID=624147 RepID=UPI0014313E3E|nr:hypothetical protein [Paenibacillus tianmuensis]